MVTSSAVRPPWPSASTTARSRCGSLMRMTATTPARSTAAVMALRVSLIVFHLQSGSFRCLSRRVSAGASGAGQPGKLNGSARPAQPGECQVGDWHRGLFSAGVIRKYPSGAVSSFRYGVRHQNCSDSNSVPAVQPSSVFHAFGLACGRAAAIEVRCATMPTSRRQFLRDLVAAAPWWPRPPRSSPAGAVRPVAAAPWDRAAAVLARIVPPRFPDRHFVITRFGAVGDGRADCTSAIRRAIAACHAAGGGRVVVPDGRFVTGAIQLASGVEAAPGGEGDAGLQPRRAALPAGGAHAVGGHRADELLAVHLRLRGGEHRHHRHAGRSTARPTPATGGTGAGMAAPLRRGRRRRATA